MASARETVERSYKARHLATIHVIANAGAMLVVGQERSREDTALTVEPGCSGILKCR